jgi:RecQ zinc-binding
VSDVFGSLAPTGPIVHASLRTRTSFLGRLCSDYKHCTVTVAHANLQETSMCRHAMLLEYFGDNSLQAQHNRCGGACDNCIKAKDKSKDR